MASDPRAPEEGSRPILAAVLAGGRSSRFGRDKALAPFRGEPMLERVLAALEGHPAIGRRVVVAADASPYRAIAARRGAGLLTDEAPGRGPLGGLVAALREADRGSERAVLALACDMPLLEPVAIEALLAAGAEAAFEVAAVGLAEGRRHPLLALWPRRALAPLAARLAEGRLSLLGALEALPEVLEVPLPGPSAANVNDPDRLAALEAQAEGKAT